jgi:hypothetical protein
MDKVIMTEMAPRFVFTRRCLRFLKGGEQLRWWRGSAALVATRSPRFGVMGAVMEGWRCKGPCWSRGGRRLSRGIRVDKPAELVGMRVCPAKVLWPRGGTEELPRPLADTSDLFLIHIWWWWWQNLVADAGR